MILYREEPTNNTKKETDSLKKDLNYFYDRERFEKNNCKITIAGKVFQGTTLKGPHASKKIKTDMKKLTAVEEERCKDLNKKNEFQIAIKK